MSQSKSLNASPPSKSRGIQVCLFLVRLFLLGIVKLVLLIGIAWAFGAVWFDFPFPVLRRPLAVSFGLAAIGMLALLRPRYERDIVRVRTNIRREAVYLYHLIPATPERSRAFFLDYVKTANELHEQPQHVDYQSTGPSVAMRLFHSRRDGGQAATVSFVIRVDRARYSR
jgi:hypothetical protein